jgi:hypothetical protein
MEPKQNLPGLSLMSLTKANRLYAPHRAEPEPPPDIGQNSGAPRKILR